MTKVDTRLSRRHFIALAAAALPVAFSGCATNPVSGKKQFMLVSEAEEISLDRQWAPHQFSSDYGAVQDVKLNKYVASVAGSMSSLTHRPHMPYNIRVLNTVIVNGYTMPAGSIGLARGLMLNMQSEAELAAVIGHEFGHVNARHAGERMSKTMLAQLFVAGLAVYAESESEDAGMLAAGLGMIGSQMLLSRYSRDDEREADALGMEYMVRAGYHPSGMVDLMEGFVNLHSKDPGLVDILFSTHPMSKERLSTARSRVTDEYARAASNPVHRQRYMDNTASLRAIAPAIGNMQKAEHLMMKKKYTEAEALLGSALKIAPNDYAGLMLRAKCSLVQEKYNQAELYVEKARRVYPKEPMAWHLNGIVRLKRGRYQQALNDFTAYEQKLPGNPNTVYFKGNALDNMGRRDPAALEYKRYLRMAPSGEYAAAAKKRLSEWGHTQG